MEITTHIFGLDFLVSPAGHQLLHLVQVDQQLLLILQTQLLGNDGQIANWVYLTLDVRHIRIVECTWEANTQKMENKS